MIILRKRGDIINKGIRFLAILFLMIGVGTFAFFKFSKSSVSVAARTLANMQKIESVSMDMTVGASVKVEVGFLQFFGLDDPETTILMDYDIDAFRGKNLVHANVKINAFGMDILDNVEVIITNEEGGAVQYYRVNGNWYRYASDSVTEDSVLYATEDMVESAVSVETYSSSTDYSGREKKRPVAEKNENGEGQEWLYLDAQTETWGFADFREILEGINNGDLSVTMRKEKVNVHSKECFAYDLDLTGDMLEKVVCLSGEETGLIANLNANEHISGTLYIDSDEYLPTALQLYSEEILNNKLYFEQLKTMLSVNKIDIDVYVTGYNNSEEVQMPNASIDIDNISELDSDQWFSLFRDLAGF